MLLQTSHVLQHVRHVATDDSSIETFVAHVAIYDSFVATFVAYVATSNISKSTLSRNHYLKVYVATDDYM